MLKKRNLNREEKRSTILTIESSTDIGSVALVIDGEVTAERELEEPRGHAALISIITKELLNEAKVDIKELSSVAVSIGPGSYTGLRVGLSFAKGLCYGLGSSLIAVPTLETVAAMALERSGAKGVKVVPMIDARRMEVYTALYNDKLELLSEVEAVVVDEESFKELLKKEKVLFAGEGAEKCISLIDNKNGAFELFYPTAAGMAKGAYKRELEGQFEDVAYLEPFYLKEFIPGKPKSITAFLSRS